MKSALNSRNNKQNNDIDSDNSVTTIRLNLPYASHICEKLVQSLNRNLNHAE